jgi:CubicO group peptidase (beta-lactamase class C family)
MAADTICRVGSMTKPIVAACAMTLVEDRTLCLDDPVDEFLPELADMTVLAGSASHSGCRTPASAWAARTSAGWRPRTSATTPPARSSSRTAPMGTGAGRRRSKQVAGAGLDRRRLLRLRLRPAGRRYPPADGTRHGERVLSRPSVTLMTSDHLTPAQKAVSGFQPGYFDDIGWGFGMSVRTRRTHLGPWPVSYPPPTSFGSYGWSGDPIPLTSPATRTTPSRSSTPADDLNWLVAVSARWRQHARLRLHAQCDAHQLRPGLLGRLRCEDFDICPEPHLGSQPDYAPTEGS